MDIGANASLELTIKELREHFREYIVNQGVSYSSANLIVNNAFYAYNNDFEYDISDILFSGEAGASLFKKHLLERFKTLYAEDVATDKANDYTEAFVELQDFCKKRNVHSLRREPAHNIEKTHIILQYCKNIRMNFSYKPVLILALLARCDIEGKASTEAISSFFRDYYTSRRNRGMLVEQDKSEFLNCDITDSEITTILLNSPGRVLLKDGLLSIADRNSFQVSDALVPEFHYDQSAIRKACEEAIEKYYERLKNRPRTIDAKSGDAVFLGAILSGMYKKAAESEKVISIYLFGIRYAPMIKEKGCALKEIVECAGLPISYTTELRKAVALSKYVKEIE